MSADQSSAELPKPCHTIILDASPLLLNTPGISTLRANSHELLTTPSVLSEIKHDEAKNRIDTIYMPFLTIRTPKPDSIRFVRDFARKTGDGAVLSHTDFEILALAYELECERNGGDWRLRSTPGQKRVNGSPPEKTADPHTDDTFIVTAESQSGPSDVTQSSNEVLVAARNEAAIISQKSATETNLGNSQVAEGITGTAETEAENTEPTDVLSGLQSQEEPASDSASSDEGWITPSNIKKHKAKDDGSDRTNSSTKALQVATMTGDFAMQNVLLQINLNLLSTKTCKRISSIKQFILRCHACFATTKDMSKQFCARCGKPTLTRVSCTTNDKGEVKLHLKTNMQWNNRGNVYSIPKPSAGTANQKWQGTKQGGGQNGWGRDLILAEDQKEYVRAMSGQRRAKDRDLMDEDTLPGILTGDRGKMGGRVKVGAGRNVNSKKR